MAVTLYPARKRCLTCRSGFDVKGAIKGLYCSYNCADMKAPVLDPSLAPRGCKRQVDGRWGFKQKFRYHDEVPERLRNDPGTNIYWCDYCGFLHVGHSRPDPLAAVLAKDRLNRKVSDAAELGSVIKRHRELKGVTLKQVADVLRVPQVRIREIEEGERGVSLGLTINLMRVLRMELVVSER